MFDRSAFTQAANLVAGPGRRLDGASLLKLRGRILEIVDDATAEVEAEAQMSAQPKAELMLVDRHGWIGGNYSTLARLFEDVKLPASQSRVVSWEGGAFMGLIARAVLGQYDPFRDQLLIVYPNLGEFADEQGMRWLLFHELTHVAQFREAPWIADEIMSTARSILAGGDVSWTKDAMRRIPDKLPELIRWARDAYEGKATTTPLLELLPDEQRQAIERVNSIVTVLEGHATLITELIAKRVLPGHEDINKRIEARRKRPPLMKLLEAVGGIQMKRQQYKTGKLFCDAIWEVGGAQALAPVWRGPDLMPNATELKDPEAWLDRMGTLQAR